MNRIFNITIGVALALAALWNIPTDVYAGGSVVTKESRGTVTQFCTIDADSLSIIGTDHNAPGAVKTPWFPVPFGVPFAVYIECRDLDSSLIFGGDTIHVGLESAPEGSLPTTSTNTKAYRLPQLVFNSGSLNYKNWPQRDYFTWAPADTLPVDTITQTTAYGKVAGVGGAARLNGFGMYRFSLCGDDADSVTDGALRFNATVVYQRKEAGTGN